MTLRHSMYFRECMVTDAERLAAVRWDERLGQLMGIADVPDTCDGLADLMDAHECDTYVADAKARAVADSTLDLFVTFYPDRPRGGSWRSRTGRLVDVWVGLTPARRRPSLLHNTHRIRSYPGEFMIERLRTFADAEQAGRVAG